MSLSVNSISSFSTNHNQKITKKQQQIAFKGGEEEDKTNNGNFDTDVAIKNFGKGVISPITAIIKHPVATIGLLAGTAVACSVVPILAPLLAIGFGAVGAYELGKSGYKIVKNAKEGNYDEAEKAFEGLGEGAINTYLSILGIKQGAQVVKEAKLLESLKVNKLTTAQRAEIAAEIKQNGLIKNFKEIMSLFGKEGRKAAAYQFKPSNMKYRIEEMFNVLKGKKVREKETQIIEKKFVETAEGRRRAALTKEELRAEIDKLAKESFDEYGVPEELRPKIEICDKEMTNGGGYNAAEHRIEINERGYREGVFNLYEVLKHESTHAKEALARELLTQAQKNELTLEYLLGKIKNGDNNTVIYNRGVLGFETITPPKMSPKMKAEFAEFAKTNLYKNITKFTEIEDMIPKVKPLLDNNPEFATQYENLTEALEMLAKYAKSHEMRYWINTKGTNLPLTKQQILQLGKLKDVDPAQSFRNHLQCCDGNASNATFASSFLGGGDYNQYQFAAEEVLAQQNGNKFAIRHLQEDLEALRSEPNYDKELEQYLLREIKKAENTIIYKTKGKEYYKLFMESKHNPENKELAKKVAELSKELEQYAKGIKIKTTFDTNRNSKVIIEIENEVFVLKRIRPGVSIFVPLSTTSTADILAEEMAS